MRSTMFQCVALLFLLVSCASHNLTAGLITFTERSTFDSYQPMIQTELDFDSLPTGTIASGSTIDDITFTYSFTGGVELTVTDAFDATSGANSLGTNDGGDALQDGDDLNFTFASPIKGFGLYIISPDTLEDGDFELTIGATTASLVAANIQNTLGDGGKVWFLGIQSDDATLFSSASLTTHGGGGAFTYNLDNFVTAVPEPSSLFLIGTIAAAPVARRFAKRWRGSEK
jgi:hypothetical protein